MPWLLTTPIDAGDLDSGTYAEVKIIRFTQDPSRERFNVRLEYGNTVDGKWISGFSPRSKDAHATIMGTDYTDLVSAAVPDVQTSDPADAVKYEAVGAVWVERTYYAVKRALYEWLNTNGIIDAGSIV